MAGNRRVGIVLQERDRRLLEELNVMRVADRDQAQAAAGFGSVTRVNARLLGLTRAGLLRRFFVGTSGTDRKRSTRCQRRARSSSAHPTGGSNAERMRARWAAHSSSTNWR